MACGAALLVIPILIVTILFGRARPGAQPGLARTTATPQRTVYLESEPVGPGPDVSSEPSEVASEQDWSADFADDEDPVSALEVD